MLGERQYGFVDEFGDPNVDLSVQGASSHFVVTALIVDEGNIPGLEKGLGEIRKRNFQRGEIRSRLVGKNDGRRKKILKELTKLNFHVVGLVVDKSRIASEGLRWKWSFYKFMNGLLYKELYRSYPNLKLVVDVIGSKEFMESFKSYVEERHIPDLFNEADFGFVPSRSSLLVQAADFICGTIARCYDRTVLSEAGSEFMRIMSKRIVGIREWPREWTGLMHDPKGEEDPELAAIISRMGITSAMEFISENEDSPEGDVIDRVQLVRFLLFNFRWVDRNGWVSTRSIIRNLAAGRGMGVRERHLRSRVVAPLRDEGVLIASSVNGYKLPANKKDLIEFVNHSNAIIRPIIDRVLRCRQSVVLGTKNKFDFLDYPEFEYLKAMSSYRPFDK